MQLTVANLKAYGDFVIVCSALKRIDSRAGWVLPNIVAGEHVRDLASALNLDDIVHFIGDASWENVPAIFDIRKRGGLAALNSFFEIRRLLKKLPSYKSLVFDTLGWRERWLGSGFHLHTLPEGCENIYIAYDNFFRNLGFDVDDNFFYKKNIKHAIIIPGARLHHKVIPAHVTSAFAAELAVRNISVDVIVLEGESLDIPTHLNSIVIPREFAMLINQIKKSDLVISADSLPSHLSEYFQIPIFVSTSEPNPYWLPRSSYETHGWATFSIIEPFQSWLGVNFDL